jgi:hypothetical protein
MTMKRIILYFLGISLLTFSVSAIVTFLYSLLVHSTNIVDWETSFRLGIILGIVLTWNYARELKKKQ